MPRGYESEFDPVHTEIRRAQSRMRSKIKRMDVGTAYSIKELEAIGDFREEWGLINFLMDKGESGSVWEGQKNGDFKLISKEEGTKQ